MTNRLDPQGVVLAHLAYFTFAVTVAATYPVWIGLLGSGVLFYFGFVVLIFGIGRPLPYGPLLELLSGGDAR